MNQKSTTSNHLFTGNWLWQVRFCLFRGETERVHGVSCLITDWDHSFLAMGLISISNSILTYQQTYLQLYPLKFTECKSVVNNRRKAQRKAGLALARGFNHSQGKNKSLLPWSCLSFSWVLRDHSTPHHRSILVVKT